MAGRNPLDGVQERIRELAADGDSAEARNRTSLRAVIAFLALAGWLFYTATQGGAPKWLFIIPLAGVAAAGRWHGRNHDRWLRLLRLRKSCEAAEARLEDRWHGYGYSGEEFREAHHVYDQDLQVLGIGSLFELMAIARTGIGRRQLAAYLLNPCSSDETRARQNSVRELQPQTPLRERLQLLGKFSFQESTWEVFAGWVAVPAATAPGAIRVLTFAASGTMIATVVGGFSSNIPWSALVPLVTPLFAVLMAVAWFYRTRTSRLKSAANRVGVEISVVREGVELLARETFKTEKLISLQRRLSDENAVRALRKLERLTDWLAQCEKPQFDLFAQALAVRTQLCFAIEDWKQQHGAHLKGWLNAWGEFEALAAISGYAWEHPDDVFPEFVSDTACFEAKDLGHPLIPAIRCVRNDVTLDDTKRFYVISGSNMAGKSTLLRSIGVNAVLAYAGAPFRATSMQLSKLEVFASLSIVDSILEGKSKFLAEVERVRKMLEKARGAPVLFLIDEILSGTNSRDRRVASEAVIRSLIELGAIGALSTHDLALTEIARIEQLAGTNVHMGARPGDDPMDFDYRLKPGVTTETNALAIAAMMGVLAT